MRIGFYIGALLYQHDCVVIPGFGGFIANYAPACIHPVQNTFIPPSRQIMFNAGLIHNDGLLASHVATEEGISYDQALNRISEEVMAYHAELKAGKTVHMDGLGSFRTNHEDSLVFTPDTRINWLEEAFGLPTFVSPAIRRSGYRSKRDSDDKVRSIYLPVAVRRIAAIAIPVLAIGMWSLFNTSRINSFASNYSSIVPSDLISHLSFSSLKKSVPVYVLSHSRIDVNKKQIQPEINKEGPQSPDINSTPVPAPENPAVTSPESTPTSNAGQPAVQHHYLIIGGAFKVKENAEKFIAQLKAKNLNATIAGQNKKGLYMVSVASYDDAGQANLSLKELSGKGIESAWILNNQKL